MVAVQAYQSLTDLFSRLRSLDDAAGILGWDAQTLMPAGAAEGRAEQLATLRGLSHDLLVAPATDDWLRAADAAEPGTLEPWERANLREMRRAHAHAAAVPPDLVVAASKATSRAEMAWRTARAASDFALLAPHLREVLAIQREVARCKGEALRLDPYDALLDQFDPGLRQARIDPLFDRLRIELPGLIEGARQRGGGETLVPVAGTFPITAQRALGEEMMRTVGFDFERGRLDTSLHPFCGGATGDVRITTRYSEADFTRSLMGVLHETGHALYEQGRPARWQRQPVGEARGMVLHESQSLLIEMQACRTREFLTYLSPRLAAIFERVDPALEAGNLHRLYTRIEPGFIRVDADEVTYPAHILLRYDLERAMIGGALDVEDLPAAFNEGLRALLGLVVPDDARGCLQDIHWPSGAWGYFPTYTLGAVAAAQLFAAACTAEPGILPGLAAGDFTSLVGWLRREIHGKGSLLDTDELMIAATGSPLGPEPYLAHLRRRYGGDAVH